MKKIKLTQGKEALVDDCDHTYLMQWTWCFQKQSKGGYAKRRGEGGRTILMHREVGKRIGLQGRIDHKNRIKLDNQRRNIRLASQSQNMGNDGLRANNKSGFKGVSLFARDQLWVPHIMLKGRCKHLGRFPSTEAGKIEAAYAYTVAATKIFKKFSCFNPVGHLLDSQTKRRIKQDVLRRLEGFE